MDCVNGYRAKIEAVIVVMVCPKTKVIFQSWISHFCDQVSGPAIIAAIHYKYVSPTNCFVRISNVADVYLHGGHS